MTVSDRKAEQQRLAQLAYLDYLRHAATARGSRVVRVGPGPDRPIIHSYAEARQAHRRAVADCALLRAAEPC